MLLHPTFTGFATGLERRRDLIYEAEKWRRLRVASLRCTPVLQARATTASRRQGA
jgi:hypothetical protein